MNQQSIKYFSDRQISSNKINFDQSKQQSQDINEENGLYIQKEEIVKEMTLIDHSHANIKFENQVKQEEQIQIRFYIGYQTCKYDDASKPNNSEIQPAEIINAESTLKNKRKYVQKKLWKGICSILDRKQRFTKQISEIFDKYETSNNGVDTDQCRLWKNVMNKHILKYKLNKKNNSARDDLFNLIIQDAPKKKKRSGYSKTTKIIEHISCNHPFQYIMLPDFGNLPYVSPQICILQNTLPWNQQVKDGRVIESLQTEEIPYKEHIFKQKNNESELYPDNLPQEGPQQIKQEQ